MRILLVLALGAALVPSSAAAQADTATISAGLGPVARLTFSSMSLSFADADPDAVPEIQGSPAFITITAKARAHEGEMVTLTVQASDDLRSGMATIPASQISWTATGAGFVDGTLSSTSAQPVARWVGSGIRTGTQSFRFKNLWSYPTGTYTLTMIFTLTAA